jgi:hypothetical protein
MAQRDRKRSRGAMSVEYALMLVVITGAVAGVLGLGATRMFQPAECALASAMGTPCGADGSGSSDPLGGLPDPGPTAGPTQAPVIASNPTPSCSPTSSAADPSLATALAEPESAPSPTCHTTRR